MIKKPISILLMFFISFFSFANVTVIGITINEDRKEDVLKKYNAVEDNNGNFILNPSEVPIEGVRSAGVGFDKKSGVVKYLVIGHNNSKYDYFFDLLNKKYKLVKKTKPSPGARYSEFEKDNVIIILNSNYESENMLIAYVDKKIKMEDDEDKKKENQRKLKEIDQL